MELDIRTRGDIEIAHGANKGAGADINLVACLNIGHGIGRCICSSAVSLRIDEGSDVSLAVPGVLVNAAIALCPVPNDAELNARLREMSPALGAVASRLATLPDAVLVDIKSEDKTLRVEKSGSELLIRVNSPNERVEVAVPLTSVRKLMEKLAA